MTYSLQSPLMLRLLAAALLFTLFAQPSAWAQEFLVTAGGEGYEATYEVALDDASNAYVIGEIESTTDFDPGPGVVELVPPAGDGAYAKFVASYDPDGALRWAFQIDDGGGFDETLAVDGAGTVYVGGEFSGTVDFDPGAGTEERTIEGSTAYVASYASDGTFRFVLVLGDGNPTTDGRVDVVDLALDASGNVYVTGQFEGTVDFDPGAGTEERTNGGNAADAYVASYASDGTFRSVFTFGSTDSTPTERKRPTPAALALDAGGTLYVGGQFTGTVDFDPGVGTEERTAANRNGFLAAYDAAGALVDVIVFGDGDSRVGSLAGGEAGTVYATGSFTGTVDFDPGPGTAEETVGGILEYYLASYSFAGSTASLNYVFRTNNTPDDRLILDNIVRDDAGDLFLTSCFDGAPDFDLGAGTDVRTAGSGCDIYVASYTTSGDYRYAYSLDGSGDAFASYPYSIAVSEDGRVVVAAEFEGTVDFLPGYGTNERTATSGEGEYDLAVVSFAPGFEPAVALLVDTTDDDQPYDAAQSLADCADDTADGDCTLREAIQVANANNGALDTDDLDLIVFEMTTDHGLDSDDEAVIVPLTQLPDITDPGVTINGYTQPGTSPNTLDVGSDAVLAIVLFNGTGSVQDGLRISSAATDVTVRGLSVVGFEDDGIEIRGAGAVITGNFIGVVPDGTTDVGNDYGLFLRDVAGGQVGGDEPADRNVISGNLTEGVRIDGGSVVVQGNLVGTTAAGDAPLGNGEGFDLDGFAEIQILDNTVAYSDVDGIQIEGPPSVIIEGNDIRANGDDGVNADSQATVDIIDNTITGNAGDGVEIEDDVAATILGNGIYANGELGINLDAPTDGVDGVTPNDPDDGDTGPNGLQNYPVVTGATPDTPGSYAVAFTLDSTPSTSFYIEAFASDEADPSGFGEGQRLVGSTIVTTDANGDVAGTVEATGLADGEVVTLTATVYEDDLFGPIYGPTSEFSEAFLVGEAGCGLASAELGFQSVAPTAGPTGTITFYGAPGTDYSGCTLVLLAYSGTFYAAQTVEGTVPASGEVTFTLPQAPPSGTSGAGLLRVPVEPGVTTLLDIATPSNPVFDAESDVVVSVLFTRRGRVWAFYPSEGPVDSSVDPSGEAAATKRAIASEQARVVGEAGDLGWLTGQPGVLASDALVDLPAEYVLSAAYPNPFNPQTRLGYAVPQSGEVRLAVYDVLGREVAVLVDGPVQAGRHVALFDGSHLASGLYLVRLETTRGAFVQTVTLAK